MTVLDDWDEELDSADWWVVSQVHRGGGGEGEEGEEDEARQRGGHRGAGEAPLPHPAEADALLRAALEERDDGEDEDNGDDEGDEGDNQGEGGDKGGGRGRGVRRGMRSKGTRGVRRGVPGARMHPGNPPPRRRGSLRVATGERGPGGQWG